MIETYPSTAALAEAAADAVASRLVEAIRTHGRAGLVGTGGRAPGPVYDRLCASKRPDWARVVVTLSDERCIDPTAPESNERLVRERLLIGAAAKAHFVPLWPEPDPAALAALMPFDAVLLGMGEDGHIASLIPGSRALEAGMDLNSGRLTVFVPEGAGNPPLARISLTLPALLQSRAIFLLIAGKAKREVVERALAGAPLPVAALLAQDRVPLRVLWSPT